MANKNPECQKCPYNIFKSKGGYGKVCNGYTMAEEKRCPEWRIKEMQRENEKAADRTLKQLFDMNPK